jgi:simple sugar transport system substrate-binding protein
VGLAAAWALAAGFCASAADVKTLAIMLPEEPTDFGWNQQAFEAAKAVAAKYHLKFMPASGLGYGDVHAELRELADDGASLIIAHASGYNTAAPEIGAEKHVPVAIVDRPKDSKPGAVADYTLSGRGGLTSPAFSRRKRPELTWWPSSWRPSLHRGTASRPPSLRASGRRTRA